MVFCSWSLNLIYQFWVHTERIDRLPRWFEFVFNTPSHHRVHHGMDPVYLDKNYGGILIIWDRLFGSFQPELFRPHYGLTKRVDTFNIWKLQTREYVAIVRDWRSATRLRDRLGYVFGPPGWEPRTIDKSNAAASWSRLGNVATRHCESITVGFWYALAVTGGGRCAWPRRMGVQGGPPGTTRIRSDGRPIGGRVFAGDRQCRSGLGVPGMEIRQDNHVCTLGYVDPALKIAFTAGIVGAGSGHQPGLQGYRPSQGLPGQHTQRLHRGHARVDRRLRGDCAG